MAERLANINLGLTQTTRASVLGENALRIGALALALSALTCATLPSFAENIKFNKWRDPFLQPFSSSSVWNTPLGRGAIFQTSSDPETQMLRSENVGGRAGSYSWIDRDTVRIYRQEASNPVAHWLYDSRSATAPWPHQGDLRNSSFTLRTPTNIEFLTTDQYAVIVTEDAKFAYEVWKGSYDTTTNVYKTRYIVGTDLYGSGIAKKDHTSDGIRAFGGSLLGGLIRCNDLDNLSISHAIAIVLSGSQLKAGPTVDDQKVWPASETDNGGRNSYAGLIPMGALIAIPISVDLKQLGLSPEGLALARAYQEFGGYVVDAAPKTMALGSVEAGCKKEQVDHLAQDRRKLLPYLSIIINNSINTPGGPGERLISAPAPLPN